MKVRTQSSDRRVLLREHWRGNTPGEGDEGQEYDLISVA
jgi:hypothetical protein